MTTHARLRFIAALVLFSCAFASELVASEPASQIPGEKVIDQRREPGDHSGRVSVSSITVNADGRIGLFVGFEGPGANQEGAKLVRVLGYSAEDCAGEKFRAILPHKAVISNTRRISDRKGNQFWVIVAWSFGEKVPEPLYSLYVLKQDQYRLALIYTDRDLGTEFQKLLTTDLNGDGIPEIADLGSEASEERLTVRSIEEDNVRVLQSITGYRVNVNTENSVTIVTESRPTRCVAASCSVAYKQYKWSFGVGRFVPQ